MSFLRNEYFINNSFLLFILWIFDKVNLLLKTIYHSKKYICVFTLSDNKNPNDQYKNFDNVRYYNH